jgi:hypothetical protein
MLAGTVMYVACSRDNTPNLPGVAATDPSRLTSRPGETHLRMSAHHLHILSHPLVNTRLANLRQVSTTSKEFREV